MFSYQRLSQRFVFLCVCTFGWTRRLVPNFEIPLNDIGLCFSSKNLFCYSHLTCCSTFYQFKLFTLLKRLCADFKLTVNIIFFSFHCILLILVCRYSFIFCIHRRLFNWQLQVLRKYSSVSWNERQYGTIIYFSMEYQEVNMLSSFINKHRARITSI